MVEENGTSGGSSDPLGEPHPIAVTNVREATIVTYNTQAQKVRDAAEQTHKIKHFSRNEQFVVSKH